MATIVPATIAAAVSLLVAFLGHWQWRRQQAAAAADRYHAERADALKELWNKLNDHSTAARIARLDSEQFYRNIQDLNFFLIRRSPFLTESEKDLAHLYLESIYAFRIKERERADLSRFDAAAKKRAREELEQRKQNDLYSGLIERLRKSSSIVQNDALLAADPTARGGNFNPDED